jgi:hypothetical protein
MIRDLSSRDICCRDGFESAIAARSRGDVEGVVEGVEIIEVVVIEGWRRVEIELRGTQLVEGEVLEMGLDERLLLLMIVDAVDGFWAKRHAFFEELDVRSCESQWEQIVCQQKSDEQLKH